MPLTQDRRKQLDDIVVKMAEKKAPKEDVQAVVSDFTSKYGSEEQAAPSPALTQTPTPTKKRGGIAEFAESSNNAFFGGAVRGLANLGKMVAPNSIDAKIDGALKRAAVDQGTADREVSGSTAGQWGSLLGKGQLETAKAVPQVLMPYGKGLLGALKAVSGSGATSFVDAASRTGDAKKALTEAKNTALISGGMATAGAVARNALPGILGITTGSGKHSIEQAYRAGKKGSTELVDAMRGNTSPETILENAQDAMRQVRGTQLKKYSDAWEKVQGRPFEADQNKMARGIAKTLQQFDLMDDTGKMTFGRSAVSDPAEIGLIQRAISDVENWDDLSVKGVDTLKQRLDNLYSPTLSKRAKAVLKGMRDSVATQLNDVDGYTGAKGNFARDAKFLDEAEKSLSMGEGKTRETALRKLLLSNNNNPTYDIRRNAIKELDERTGASLQDALAGYQLNSWVPRGIVAPLATGSASAALTALNPLALATAPLYSPRLMGEVANTAGKVAGKIGGKIPVNMAGREAIKREIAKLMSRGMSN